MTWEASLEDLSGVAQGIMAELPRGSVLALYGDLGAGKTTLVKALLRELGYAGEVSSPTYSLVNVYDLEGEDLYHIDLYRLETVEEALDIDIESYLYPSTYTFIEWPQLVEDFMPEAYFTLQITSDGGLGRRYELVKS